MTENEKAGFMQLWAAVVESYNRKPPSDRALMIVALQLEQYPLIDIKRAIAAHGVDRNNDGFPPTTNDIARLIEGDGKSAGLQAFSKALNAAGRVGAGASVCFDDPAINQVIQDMGGWIAFCMSDEQELKTFKIHEFDKRYRGCMISMPDDYPRKLIGSEEAYNQINWPNRKHALRLIGDFEKAKAVHELAPPEQMPSSTEYLHSSSSTVKAIACRRPPELQLIQGRLEQERAIANQADAEAARERNELAAALDRKSNGGES